MPHVLDLAINILGTGVLLLVLFLGVLLLSACILKPVLLQAVAEHSRNVLSVEAACERVEMAWEGSRQDFKDLSRGVVKLSIQDLTVQNPAGYASPHLLKVGKAVVGISVPRLLCSCLKQVVLRELAFQDVDANLEIKGMSSNVQEVLRFIDAGVIPADPPGGGGAGDMGAGRQGGAAQGAPGPEAGSRSSRLLAEHDAVMAARGGTREVRRACADHCENSCERTRMVKIALVAVEGATVKICAHFLGGKSVGDLIPDLPVGRPRTISDVKYEDLAQDFDLPEEVVHVIVRKFLQAAVQEGSKSGSYGVLSGFERGPLSGPLAEAAVRAALVALDHIG